jgi:cytochrome b subunit of formate dehydrogenase
MFRIFSILVVVSIIAGTVWALRSQMIQLAGTKQMLRQQGQNLFDALRQWRSTPMPAILIVSRKVFYALTLISFLLLAVTGFLPVMIFGSPISGLSLILHVTLAPIFAVCLTILTLFWAHHHRFNRDDWQHLLQWTRRESANPAKQQANPDLWQKICFWLIVTFSVPVIISIILSMYPLFGTAGQEFLLGLHGYTALFMLMAVIMHTYLILLSKQRG